MHSPQFAHCKSIINEDTLFHAEHHDTTLQNVLNKETSCCLLSTQHELTITACGQFLITGHEGNVAMFRFLLVTTIEAHCSITAITTSSTAAATTNFDKYI